MYNSPQIPIEQWAYKSSGLFMQPEKEKGHNPCEMCLCVYFRLSGPYI